MLVEPELDSGEALVVDADVAEHLSADRMLRIRTPFLGQEPEPRNLLPCEDRRAERVRLAIEIHEAARSVGELAVNGAGLDSQRPCDGRRDGSRIGDLHRVRVDARSLLAERQAHAHAVEDRAAARRKRDVLAVLRLPEP